jgi:hypothetical protein
LQLLQLLLLCGRGVFGQYHEKFEAKDSAVAYEPAYHLDGDPEGRSFAEILVDVVATEVIEPWGGGKWHLEIFRSVNPEPEDWNGEM